MTRTADRLQHLEARTRSVEERLRDLELAAAPAAPSPLAAPESAARSREGADVGLRHPLRPSRRAEGGSRPVPAPPASPTPAAPQPPLEDLLGGRVLAWVGGTAVLVGLALLFALGISNGWIGEAERCLLAGAGCAGLLGLGARLHGRRGRTEAARAAVGTGVAGLFLTLAVASSGYDLLPPALGMLLAAGVGAVAVALAVRWAAPVIASLGIVGALLAPVLAGVAGESTGLGFLAVAGAAAVAVLTWQGWRWLSGWVALVVTPQWLLWLADGPHGDGAVVLVLVGFGALQAAAAVGSAVRLPREAPVGLPAVLLAINALVVALSGWAAFENREAGIAWLAGLAAAHLALGAAARRSSRVTADLALLALALGVVLVDVSFALLADGVVRALGWAAGAVAFAALARLAGPRARDAAAAASGLGLHVGLAVLAAAQEFDPGTLFGGGAPTAGATAALATLAGACLVSARLAPTYRLVLDATGLLAAAVLTALTLDGVALTAVWALEAAALCALGARGDGDDVAWGAGCAHLLAATAWWLVDQAPPSGLAAGGTDLAQAALGGGALLAAGASIARGAAAEARGRLLGALALVALHVASLAVVDLGGGGAQLRLSGLWAVVGVAALLVGLRRDVAAIRVGALALLAVTVVKVFVYDLATQEASYRVVSFLGLGVLLLGAAFAYQRLRPEAPQDRGRTPRALR